MLTKNALSWYDDDVKKRGDKYDLKIYYFFLFLYTYLKISVPFVISWVISLSYLFFVLYLMDWDIHTTHMQTPIKITLNSLRLNDSHVKGHGQS